MQTLDVGCGNTPKGSINCDLFIVDKENHRNQQSNVLKTKHIKNFIRCDCKYLPFEDNTFETVFCSQVIEHLINPIQLLKELIRVSKSKIVIETQHYLGEKAISFFNLKQKLWFKHHHLSKFNRNWFVNSAKFLNCEVVSSKILNYTSFPHNLIGVHFPNEIQIILVKN